MLSDEQCKQLSGLHIRANGLPHLDVKQEHILSGSVMDVTDTEAAVITLDFDNTIQSFTRKVLENTDMITGFPIVKEDDGVRLQGYLGISELDQALQIYKLQSDLEEPSTPCSLRDTSVKVALHPVTDIERRVATSDTLQLGYLVDRAPVTISAKAPLQLVHQLFIRLGVRYLAVQDERGCYLGIIEKNR